MRHITGAIALGAALVLGALSTTAHAAAAPAQPARTGGLYAPTEMVLTIGQGDSRATTTSLRAATLSCMPTASGSHPYAKAACAQLRTASGDFNKVTEVASERICNKIWAPVVVTADGVWQGRRIAYTHVFANSCEMTDGKGSVFEF
ncbi:subtilase-type protease inhibitor [Streptomyces noursei]|uniref:subtilase-type protease inhibitor n=1 Tax=Streptomyces noursei TaxID=1971 RepID=UPI00081C6235|nr:subtilase-type protease inhibitor [Streptomyces noursei]ANZ19570.1 subtilisin inhibitor-like protein [Streptomyces noursei ATCC 11455]MCZ0996022.1 subtilase-type protease inhibitor [Streptomyces noursei]MCZ1014936.1 subtilase-type protease inhibitor [Streptomyces noursei]GGX38405.1 subtilase-type protease inhibitor [Streptomyces noursei]